MRYAPITEWLSSLGSDRWALHIAARRRAASGEQIIELTIGEPDIAPDPALLGKEQVAVMPGASFGDEAKDFVRLSLTVPDARIGEACRRIARFAAGLADAAPRAAQA